MCGIAGFIDTQRATGAEVMADLAARMAGAIAHRGPDDAGVWVDPAAGIAFGHRRLSVIDPTPGGHQPMVSAAGRWVIVFNGEVYNHLALRARLESGGVRLRTRSDTEALIETIACWGVPAALDAADMMGAFAAWDREREELWLARDRFGEKPLYHGWAGTTFVFGSELAAIRAHPALDARVDRAALADFLRHGTIPPPRSILEGVAKLGPGSLVCVRARHDSRRQPAPQRWWSAEEVAQRSIQTRAAGHHLGDRDAILDRLERAVDDAVSSRLISDVPLGAFLSGGVDSSLVVASMQAHSSQPVRTFTIGFTDRRFDESGPSAAVARHLGTDHTSVVLTDQDALDLVPAVASTFDEPFADSSQIPTLLVCRLARQSVTVALSGDGGDELFGGYTRYHFMRRIEPVLRRVPWRARRTAGQAIASVPARQWDAAGRTLARVRALHVPPRVGDKALAIAHVLGAPDAPSAYSHFMDHWDDPGRVVLGAEAAPSPSPAVVAGLDPAEWAMAVDAGHYLPDDLLTKVDRASMSVALEVRVPLLAPALYELAWSLPPSVRLDGLTRLNNKPLLRALLARRVPRELTDRPKAGFGIPLAEWLRGPLRPWAEDLLAPRALAAAGCLDPALVRQCWAEHLAGTHDWKYQLWDVLVFQAWYERWQAGTGSPAGSPTASTQPR